MIFFGKSGPRVQHSSGQQFKGKPKHLSMIVESNTYKLSHLVNELCISVFVLHLVISALFTTFFLWTSLQFIFVLFCISNHHYESEVSRPYTVRKGQVYNNPFLLSKPQLLQGKWSVLTSYNNMTKLTY